MRTIEQQVERVYLYLKKKYDREVLSIAEIQREALLDRNRVEKVLYDRKRKSMGSRNIRDVAIFIVTHNFIEVRGEV